MTTTTKTFAPDFERNEQGWIKFPRDIEYRRTMFPNPKLEGSTLNVFDHPAKQQLYLCEEAVKYLTEPGDWILDPFGGAGTTAVAARMGRHVMMLEIEDYYCDLIKESGHTLVPGGMPINGRQGEFEVWDWLPPTGPNGQIRLMKGDCRRTMREIAGSPHPPFKCIITSPPYALSVNRGGHELEAEGSKKGLMAAYNGSPNNLSQLNSFYWEEAMNKVWQGCADLLEPGGTMLYTCRDTIEKGQRDMLSAALIRSAEKFGLKYREWYKWELPSTLRQAVNKKQGGGAVTDEDIIILEKV